MLPLLVTACGIDSGGIIPVEVPFETHESVLRGTYAGEMEGGMNAGETLSLTFTPSYIDKKHYGFTAQGTLGDSAVTAAGTVVGTVYDYLAPQTTPAPPTSLDFQLMYADGEAQGFNCFYRYGAGDWECLSDRDDAGTPEGAATVMLTKQN